MKRTISKAIEHGPRTLVKRSLSRSAQAPAVFRPSSCCTLHDLSQRRRRRFPAPERPRRAGAIETPRQELALGHSINVNKQPCRARRGGGLRGIAWERVNDPSDRRTILIRSDRTLSRHCRGFVRLRPCVPGGRRSKKAAEPAGRFWVSEVHQSGSAHGG